jgi:hypothetical protein
VHNPLPAFEMQLMAPSVAGLEQAQDLQPSTANKNSSSSRTMNWWHDCLSIFMPLVTKKPRPPPPPAHYGAPIHMHGVQAGCCKAVNPHISTWHIIFQIMAPRQLQCNARHTFCRLCDGQTGSTLLNGATEKTWSRQVLAVGTQPAIQDNY